jgi:hypothetical protein
VEPYQNGEDADKGDGCCNIYQDLIKDLPDEDLFESSDIDKGIVFNETEEQENACADLMEQDVRRLCGNHTEADIHNLVHANVRHFHPDRRFDECLPSMMLRRQNLVALMDQHLDENTIMDTDKVDDLLQRI